METEEEVDILMSSDIYSATLSTKSISFTRAQTGWLFREDKTVCANLDFFNFKNCLFFHVAKIMCGGIGKSSLLTYLPVVYSLLLESR